MSGYIGQTPLSKASLTRQNIIKTEPFTTLNVAGGYVRGNIDVYVNGVYIHPLNYTAEDGLTITFDSEFFAGTGDDAVEIEIRQIQSFQLADAYTKTETDLLFDPADPSAKVGTAASLDQGTGATDLLNATDGYYKGNILGTVSQSGGVPTGAIIERGSNSNGEYVKFADGTMICTERVTELLRTPLSLTEVSGIYAYFLTFSGSRALPANSVSTPEVSITASKDNNQKVWASHGPSSNTSFHTNGCAAIEINSSAVEGVYEFYFIAIGRWW